LARHTSFDAPSACSRRSAQLLESAHRLAGQRSANSTPPTCTTPPAVHKTTRVHKLGQLAPLRHQGSSRFSRLVRRSQPRIGARNRRHACQLLTTPRPVAACPSTPDASATGVSGQAAPYVHSNSMRTRWGNVRHTARGGVDNAIERQVASGRHHPLHPCAPQRAGAGGGWPVQVEQRRRRCTPARHITEPGRTPRRPTGPPTTPVRRRLRAI